MKKQMEVIEVPATGKPRWYGGAYTHTFVYSPKGNFLLKGYSEEVEEYINKHFRRSFYRMVMYHGHGSRTIAKFSDACNLMVTAPKLKRKGYQPWYTVYPYGHSKTMKPLGFKRFPKKWIPEYDQMIDQYGEKEPINRYRY